LAVVVGILLLAATIGAGLKYVKRRERERYERRMAVQANELRGSDCPPRRVTVVCDPDGTVSICEPSPTHA